MTVRLTPQKAEKIRDLCIDTLGRECMTIRHLAVLVGQMVASEPGVQFAPRFYKQLEIERDHALRLNKGNFDGKVTISQKARADIQWWIDNVKSSFQLVETPEPHLVVRSDSSDFAWGGVCGNVSTGGLWNESEAEFHINFKELKAAFLALQTFCKSK